MTAIAGLVHEGNVYIGGDSAGVAGLSLQVRADAKVFIRERRADRWAFGFTSSFRMGQLIRYALDLPELPENADDLPSFMVTRFVDKLRDCLKAGGYAERVYEVESGGTFLVGVRGRLFCVHEDYQVAEPANEFAAVGCGAEIVRGALFATSGGDMEPERRLDVALQAAERFSAGVRGPFKVVSV